MLFRERHGAWLSASNLVAPGPLWASWRGAAYPGGRGRRRGCRRGHWDDWRWITEDEGLARECGIGDGKTEEED